MKVVVADDHRLMVEGIRRALEGAEDIEIVGEASTGSQVLPLVRRLHPDVVLLDVQLPDGDGFMVASWLAREQPGAVVVLTSSRDASDYGDRVAASACGFIGKSELSGERFTALVGAA